MPSPREHSKALQSLYFKGFIIQFVTNLLPLFLFYLAKNVQFIFLIKKIFIIFYIYCIIFSVILYIFFITLFFILKIKLNTY